MFTVSGVLFLPIAYKYILYIISKAMMRSHFYASKVNDVHHIFSTPGGLPFFHQNRITISNICPCAAMISNCISLEFKWIIVLRLLQLKQTNWHLNGLHISCKYLCDVYKIIIIVVMIAGAQVYSVQSVVVAHASHANNSVFITIFG